MLFFRNVAIAAGLVATSVSALDVAVGDYTVLNIDPNILKTGSALINVGVLANVLGVGNCSSSSTGVGVKLNVQVPNPLNLLSGGTGNILNACACVDIGNRNPLVAVTCPACPANASPICQSANCGCECNFGYYAATVGGKNVCVPNSSCGVPNVLVRLLTGKSQCVCGRGFIDDLAGGCINACLVV